MEPSWPLSWKSGATRRGPRPHAFAAPTVARQTRTSRNMVPAATQTSIPPCASYHIMCCTPVIMVLLICDYMALWLTRICRLEQTCGYSVPDSWFRQVSLQLCELACQPKLCKWTDSTEHRALYTVAWHAWSFTSILSAMEYSRERSLQCIWHTHPASPCKSCRARFVSHTAQHARCCKQLTQKHA